MTNMNIKTRISLKLGGLTKGEALLTVFLKTAESEELSVYLINQV